MTIPVQQTCCGLPAFALGDMKTARDLARKNVLAFSEDRLDAVVVSCSSCATHIKTAYPELLAEETALRPKVEDFIRKVEELSQFITQRDLNLTPLHPLPLKPSPSTTPVMPKESSRSPGSRENS